jgi:Mg-chelatase subunit ChlD
MDQVFISHSSRDEGIAVAMCDRLERAGIRCWMASRDILPGQTFAGSISEAIDDSRLMLVVLSKDASKSEHVLNEVNGAVERQLPILPVKVDDSDPSKVLGYYLGKTHWFDASRPPFKSHLDKLARNVQSLLNGRAATIPMAAARRTPESLVDLAGLQILPAEVIDRDKERDRDMEERLSYSVQVSRNKPACLIFIVDQSFSMNRRIAGRDVKKKDAVADVVNNVLYNAVLASTKEDGVRHYFDVGILGYGAGDGVKSVFDSDLVSIDWVADNPLTWKLVQWDEDDGEDGTIRVTEDVPIWLKPFGKGKTLVRDAFEQALTVVREWAEGHKDSFPPIVLHITDGEFTDRDQDPGPAVRQLQEQYTNVGSVLVFNCHLSATEEQPIMFPGTAEAEHLKGHARQLHEMSSPMPEPIRQEAIAQGYQVEMGARGYVRNADLVALVDFLNIGTRPVYAGVAEA